MTGVSALSFRTVSQMGPKSVVAAAGFHLRKGAPNQQFCAVTGKIMTGRKKVSRSPVFVVVVVVVVSDAIYSPPPPPNQIP